MSVHYPFQKAPLPYENTALLPFFDPDTIYYHHNKIYAFYVDMLNYLISSYPQLHGMSLPELMTTDLHLPVPAENQIKFYAGGVFNHDLFFSGVCSKSTGQPQGKLKEAIGAEYGSLDNFKRLFKQACYNVLGSGWVWLVAGDIGGLHIQITRDNQPPSVHAFTPILGIDVWEHSYFLRYPAQLGAYVDNWFETVSWEKAENRYESCLATDKTNNKAYG